MADERPQPTLRERFEAFKSLKRQERETRREKRFEEFKREQAAGGVIRATPESEGRNFPVGAVVGGTAGAVLSGGNPAVAALAAGAGQALQEGVEQAVESPGRSPSVREAGRRILEETFLSGAAEVGARLIPGGKLRFPRFPFGQRLGPEAQQSLTFLNSQAPALQPALLPAEATESFLVDVLQNISESSFLGGGKILRFRENRQQIFDTIADGLVDQFGQRRTPEEVGELFIQAVEENKELAQQPAQVLYNTVSTLTAPTERRVPIHEVVPIRNDAGAVMLGPAGEPLTKTVTRFETVLDNPVPVKTDSLKEFVSSKQRISDELRGIEGAQAGDTLADQVAGLGDSMTFEAAQSLRSRLIAAVDQLKTEKKGAPAIGLMKQLIKRIDAEIESALQVANPNALEMWREANRIFREGEKQFNNRVVRSLKRKALPEFLAAPESVLNAVLKPNASKRIELLRTAVGESQWPAFQSSMIEGLIMKAQREGQLRGATLERLLFNPSKGGLGRAALEKSFTQEQIEGFNRFAETVKLTQEKQTGTGRIFIQLKQAGALVELAGVGLGIAEGEVTPESVALIAGPGVIARLMVNPRTARLFTEGLTINFDSPRARAIWSGIGRLILPRREDVVPAQPPETAEQRPAFQESLRPTFPLAGRLEQ